MLYYNPNIRRKITYKIPVTFGEEQKDKKELYSYSIFTNDYKEKEIFFNERKLNVYEYNPEINFLDSLKVYNDKNVMTNCFYFDIAEKEKSIRIDRTDSVILEFMESYNQRNRNVCHGFLEHCEGKTDEYYMLKFHRVDCFLGERVKLKLFKNKEGDFSREEFYDSRTNEFQFVLENEYEYFEDELEKRVQNILQNGWGCEL